MGRLGDDPRQQRDRPAGAERRRASPRTTPRRSSSATAREPYSPPHLIDHGANLRPLLAAGCDRVLAIGSVGSLRPELGVGSFVCPDDFIALQLGDDDLRRRPRPHRRPASTAAGASESSTAWEASGARRDRGRRRLLADDRAAVRDAGRDPADGRPRPPRRDDPGLRVRRRRRARARLRGVCVVDNLANGIGAAPIDVEELEAHRERNAARLARRPRDPAAGAGR